MKIPNIEKAEWTITKYKSITDSLDSIFELQKICKNEKEEQFVLLTSRGKPNIDAWVPLEQFNQFLKKVLDQYRNEVENL